MTVSSVSQSALAGSSQSLGTNPVAQDWKALQGALSQGSQSDAQTAYTSLVSHLAKSPTGSPSPNSPVGQALSKLGSNIQNGDLDSAASDFSTLRTAVRNHHLYSGGNSSSYRNYSNSANSSGGDNSLTSIVTPPYGSVGNTLNVVA